MSLLPNLDVDEPPVRRCRQRGRGLPDLGSPETSGDRAVTCLATSDSG
ncbi:hypothetical protein V1227_09725 [Lentzea sp. DG1S-22]|nr:hypothetical protein [Lentzea sp. DG1S-22]WVH83004.1 hypothetical protein V1227_09725 [Lentzea sp. DG1S-22]